MGLTTPNGSDEVFWVYDREGKSGREITAREIVEAVWGFSVEGYEEPFCECIAAVTRLLRGET